MKISFVFIQTIHPFHLVFIQLKIEQIDVFFVVFKIAAARNDDVALCAYPVSA